MFLIIDDNQTDRLIAKAILRNTHTNYDIVEANGAEEGIEWLRSKAYSGVVCILLDIKMPEIDGFGFLRLYDDLPEVVKQNTSIYMLSSTIDKADIERANNHYQVEKLLEKPLSFNSAKSLELP